MSRIKGRPLASPPFLTIHVPFIADALLALYRYEAQPLTEEILLEEQQRAEAMLQAASDGIAPTAQDLPHGQPGELLAQHVQAALLYNHCYANDDVSEGGTAAK